MANEIPLLTEADYLRGEALAEVKHEYIGGHVYTMVGATDRHGLLIGNLFAALHHHLRGGPCQVFASDMKFKLVVAGETIFYYPDILVSCRADDRERLFRQQPCTVIEVLPESTDRTDRPEKFLAYRSVDSVREYLLVDQERMALTLFRRENAWKPEYLGVEDALALPSIAFAMPVAAVYEGVPL
ncbi:MAG: Uma2 family endonuclease [Thiotrichales bacterium]